MSEYRSVDCATYARYELAILRRERLQIGWQDAAGVTHIDLVRPLDLETARGEEFLLASAADGGHLRIRLDRILRSVPVGPKGG